MKLINYFAFPGIHEIGIFKFDENRLLKEGEEYIDYITQPFFLQCPVSLTKIRSKSRYPNIVIHRQALAYYIKKKSENGIGLERIGKYLNQNHSTIIYSIKRINDILRFGTIKEKEILKKYGIL